MKKLNIVIIACIALAFLLVAQWGAFAGMQPHFIPDRRHNASGIVGQTVTLKKRGQPVQCSVDIKTNSGVPVAVVDTSADGSFTVTLDPGTYILTPYHIPSGNPLSGAILQGPSVTVQVKPGHYTVLELSLSLAD